jgi:hypothetical protein
MGRKGKTRMEAQLMKFLRPVTGYEINNCMRSKNITEQLGVGVRRVLGYLLTLSVTRLSSNGTWLEGPKKPTKIIRIFGVATNI